MNGSGEHDLKRLYEESKYLRRHTSSSDDFSGFGSGITLNTSGNPADRQDLQEEYNAVAEELADVQNRLKNRSKSISSEVPIEKQRRNVEEFRELKDREAKLRRQLDDLTKELSRVVYPEPVPAPVTSRGQIINIASAQEIAPIVEGTEEKIEVSTTRLSSDQAGQIADLIQSAAEYKQKTAFESFVGTFVSKHGVKTYNMLNKDDAAELIGILEDKLAAAKAEKEVKEEKEEEPIRSTQEREIERLEKGKEEKDVIEIEDKFLKEVGKSDIRELTAEEADELIRRLGRLRDAAPVDLAKAAKLYKDYQKYLSDLAKFFKSGDYESVVECYSDMQTLWYELDEMNIPPAYRVAVPPPAIVNAMFMIDTVYDLVKSGVKSKEDVERQEKQGKISSNVKSMIDRLKSVRP